MNEIRLLIIFAIAFVCTCGGLAVLWVVSAMILASRADQVMERIMADMERRKQ